MNTVPVSQPIHTVSGTDDGRREGVCNPRLFYLVHFALEYTTRWDNLAQKGVRQVNRSFADIDIVKHLITRRALGDVRLRASSAPAVQKTNGASQRRR